MAKRNRGRNRRGRGRSGAPPAAGGEDSAGPSNVTSGNPPLPQGERHDQPPAQPVRQTPPRRRNNEDTTGNWEILPLQRSTEGHGGGRHSVAVSDRLPSRTARSQNGPSLPVQPHATPQTTINSENLESQSSGRSIRPPPGSSTRARDLIFGTGSREVYGDENQPWPIFLPRSGRGPRTVPQASGSSETPTSQPRRTQNTNATPSSLEGYRDARLMLEARFRSAREEQSLQNPRSRVTLAQLDSTPRAVVPESASTEPSVSHPRSIRQAQEQPQRTPIVIRNPDSSRSSQSEQRIPDSGGVPNARRAAVQHAIFNGILPDTTLHTSTAWRQRILAARQAQQNTPGREGPPVVGWGPVATTRDTDPNRAVSTGFSISERGSHAATNNTEQNTTLSRGNSVLERRQHRTVSLTASSSSTTARTQPQATTTRPSQRLQPGPSGEGSGTSLGRNSLHHSSLLPGVGVQSTSDTVVVGTALPRLPRLYTHRRPRNNPAISTLGDTTAVPSRSHDPRIAPVPEVRRQPESHRRAIVVRDATTNDEGDIGTEISFGAQLPDISSSRHIANTWRIIPVERSNNSQRSLLGLHGGEWAEPDPEPPEPSARPGIANQALTAAAIGITTPAALIGGAVLAGVRSAGSLFTSFGRASSSAEQTPTIPAPAASTPALDPFDFGQLAEDVSVLLELYSRTEPGENGEGHRRLIESANESFSKIRKHHGIGESPTTRPDITSTTVDAACIVCYDQIADTVLIPCNHLVLCGTCCDTMGMNGRDDLWGVAVPCPMCRRIVTDRIKIYRG